MMNNICSIGCTNDLSEELSKVWGAIEEKTGCKGNKSLNQPRMWQFDIFCFVNRQTVLKQFCMDPLVIYNRVEGNISIQMHRACNILDRMTEMKYSRFRSDCNTSIDSIGTVINHYFPWIKSFIPVFLILWLYNIFSYSFLLEKHKY